ncbi:hypothetical protein Pcinc_042166, partial [Petrolisthes cinctipes]
FVIGSTTAAINFTYGGNFVYGILSTGKLFFWDHTKKTLLHTHGIPQVVSPIPLTATKNESSSSGDGIQSVVQQFFKQQQQQQQHQITSSHTPTTSS